MSGFTVDTKKLFEVVGMFEEICRDCDQTRQILSENVRRIPVWRNCLCHSSCA